MRFILFILIQLGFLSEVQGSETVIGMFCGQHTGGEPAIEGQAPFRSWVSGAGAGRSSMH